MTTVFIVDDQSLNLRILSRFARSLEEGVTVFGFDDARQAVAAMTETAPDLIVTDYVMPTMNGEEFIRRCRELECARDVPIIVVTAYEDRSLRYRALDIGASDFLLSPVDGREFCIRARNHLTLWRHQQAVRRRATALESELETALRLHAEELRRKEERLRRVIDTVPALISASDADGTILFLNSQHEQYFAFDRQRVVGASKGELFGAEYGDRHKSFDLAVLRSGSPMLGLEEAIIDRQGVKRVFLTTKAPLSAETGREDGIVTVSLDITDRKRGEQAVRESEARFRSLVEGSVLGIVIERDGVPLFANKTFAAIFGYAEPDDIIALGSLDPLVAPDERPRIMRLRNSLLEGTLSDERREFQGVTKDGSRIWLEALSQSIEWKGERALQLTIADISLRKAYEEQLQRQANFDEITGLPNRLLALDRLRSAVISAGRHHHKGGVLFIDLDHFKKVNDTWGHATGDQLLKLAAERLKGCVREEDTVARLGGDEFTVILPNIASASHTEPVVQKILHAFSQPFQLGWNEAFVSASIGVTIFPEDSNDPAMLMKNADTAMYRAKERGRNTFQFFTPELNTRARERMQIESQLVHALDRREFVLYYQPIVDARTGRLAGAEALIRWENSQLGRVQPDRFIGLAEDTGLIVSIGDWVIRTACEQLGRWRHMKLPLRMAVNISSRQLRDRGLKESIEEALDGNGVPAECLEVEITETCLLSETVETGAVLRALDEMGVRIALDDFGTGYSCLTYLKDFPVHTVKIDKSFISSLLEHPIEATVVEAIIAMAHRLHIRVVGEGVETIEQLGFIRSHGCDLAQGFYFSEALPADEFYEWAVRRARGWTRPLSLTQQPQVG